MMCKKNLYRFLVFFFLIGCLVRIGILSDKVDTQYRDFRIYFEMSEAMVKGIDPYNNLNLRYRSSQPEVPVAAVLPTIVLPFYPFVRDIVKCCVLNS